MTQGNADSLQMDGGNLNMCYVAPIHSFLCSVRSPAIEGLTLAPCLSLPTPPPFATRNFVKDLEVYQLKRRKGTGGQKTYNYRQYRTAKLVLPNLLYYLYLLLALRHRAQHLGLNLAALESSVLLLFTVTVVNLWNENIFQWTRSITWLHRRLPLTICITQWRR